LLAKGAPFLRQKKIWAQHQDVAAALALAPERADLQEAGWNELTEETLVDQGEQVSTLRT
jgi:hypothetical protein